MRKGLSRRNQPLIARLNQALAATLVLSLAAPAALAKNYDYSNTEINQKDAGGYASNNYWNGSGDSKDEGVRNGMRALNHLAALDIGGAIHYGYKGYGNYTNSQRMDDLDTLSWSKKGTMDSAAGALLSGTSGGSGANGNDYVSSMGPERDPAHMPSGSNRAGRSENGASNITKSHMLSDMDKGFLYRGETGEVAAEFEKKSGMSRETFFNELAAAEASGLSWDDPNVMEKMEARYRSFVAKIPNKEYRENIEKMHDMFSFAKKTQVLEEAAAFYKKMRWGDGGDKVAQQLNDIKGGGSDASAGGAAQGGAAVGADRAPASDVPAGVLAAQSKISDDKAPKLTKEQMGMYLGLEGTHGDDLKDFLGQEDTIFRVVSKRYRKLTPMMIGKVL